MNQSDLIISTDIAFEIRRIAEILYPLSSFGPTDGQFNWHKEPGTRGAASLMDQFFGRENRSKAHWTAVLAAVGLQYPPVSESRYANQRFSEKELGQFEAIKTADRCDDGHGIPVIPCRRMVFQWTGSKYAPAGQISTFMVR